jgi:hypothetical protein
VPAAELGSLPALDFAFELAERRTDATETLKYLAEKAFEVAVAAPIARPRDSDSVMSERCVT